MAQTIVNFRERSLLNNNLIFRRHFETHPKLQKLFPKFANVPVSELMSNTEFLTQAHTCLKGLFFVVNNLDNDELLTRALSKMTRPTYFASYMDPIHQLDVRNFYLLNDHGTSQFIAFSVITF